MKKITKITNIAIVGSLFSLQANAQKQVKPNFVVILIDDAGFADVGCYGGLIPTPNIDKLAQNGIRMSQMYNCARSCPTRASLLTGLYPQQAGVGHMTTKKGSEIRGSYQGYLNENCLTIAEVLKLNNYNTFMSGKWHVGQNQGVIPSTRGFDHSINSSNGGFYTASKSSELFIDGQKIENDDSRLPKNWYTTDVYTQFGIQYINQAKEDKKPFFLYLAYNAPHFPLVAPEEDIKLFKGKFHNGWDKIRKQIYEKQLKINLLGKNYPLTKRSPLITAWDNLDENEKMKQEMTIEVYAAMIYHLDKSIGEIVDKLKANGQYDNTVIMFLSDNGASAEDPSVLGERKDILNDKKNNGEITANTMLEQSWAESSNTPFFLYKYNTHEGGISTPFIVTYPSGIPSSQNGKIIRQYGHVIDIMSTIVGMSGSNYPKTFNGKEITPMQGINLLPAWKGKTTIRKEPLIWEHEDNNALRDGKWKIVRERTEKEFELYDMEADRSETINLAKKEPKILAEMIAKYDAMAKRIGIQKKDFGKAPKWYVPVTEY